MVQIDEEHRIKSYISAIVLVGGIYLLAAAPSIIGEASKNYKTGLENKIECVNTK